MLDIIYIVEPNPLDRAFIIRQPEWTQRSGRNAELYRRIINKQDMYVYTFSSTGIQR